MSDSYHPPFENVATIVAAYVANNEVPASELANLIVSVRAALESTAGQKAAAEPAPVELVPAVPVKKSITPDYLISLEDGQRYKSLKRHLQTKYGMSPEDYRRKWGLAADYPMVAPNYAAARSALARSLGLGRKRAEPEAEVEPAPAPAPAPEPAAEAPKRRGRAKKAA